MADDTISLNPVELATELTIAWLGNPNTRVSADEVPSFLQKMHDSVTALGSSASDETSSAATTEYQPATSVRKSLSSKDHIISMIDGKPYKTLRRHLSTHGLTPVEYRERYGLKADYPMVSENYSAARRDMAKKIGLGRKPRADKNAQQEAAPAPASPERKPRGRRKATAEA